MDHAAVFQRLQGHAAVQQLPRLRELEQANQELSRAISEASAQVTTLDRLNVFTDSPAEARVKKLEKELKETQAAYAGVATLWNQALDQLESEFPDFKLIRQVEGVVGSCLAWIQTTGPQPLPAVTHLRDQVLATYCGGADLAWLLDGLAHPASAPEQPADLTSWTPVPKDQVLDYLVQRLPREARGWSWDQGPERTVEELTRLCLGLGGSGGPMRLALALTQLETVLKRSAPVQEPVLRPDGSLAMQAAIPQGVWILECLEELIQACRQGLPEVPFGQDLQTHFLQGKAPKTGQPDETWRLFGATLRARLLGLAALEALLARASSQVSWVDRVNVFTQSATEAREKALKEALQLATERLRQTLPQIDPASLTGILGGQCVQIAVAAEQVSTQKETSSRPIDCQMYHHTRLSERLWAFRASLAQKGLPPTLRQLIDEIEQGAPGFAQEMRARMPEGNFRQLLQEARHHRQAARRAFEDWGRARGAVSAMDRINIFSESASEKAEKQAKSAWQQAERTAQMSEDLFESLLMQAVSQFPEAHLYYATEELALQVPALTAVCRSKSKTHHQGDQHHKHKTYYCEISGLDQVKAGIQSLLRLASACGCQGSESQTRLQARAAAVKDSALRSRLPEAWLEGPNQSLVPGPWTPSSQSRPSHGQGSWSEDLYLDWCLRNGLGPASPGRF